jgi:hypothetical protein
MIRRFPFLLLALLGLLAVTAVQAGGPSPFRVQPALVTNDHGWDLSVGFDFPPRCYLYADRLAFSIEGLPGSPDFQLPPPAAPDGSEQQPQFRQQFTARSCQTGQPPAALVLTVFLHGCDPDTCYFPEVRRFRLVPGLAALELPPDLASPGPPEPARWRLLADGFNVLTRNGFKDEPDFLRFLREAGLATAPMEHAAVPWWLVGGIVATAAGWTALRGGKNRWRSAVPILVALLAVSLLAYRRSPRAPGGAGHLVAVDFNANTLAEDDLADLLGNALREGAPVLLSLQPSTPGQPGPQSAGFPRVPGKLGGLQQIRLRLPDATDPRARELCQYFAVAHPPVFALLIPRNHSPAGMALNLRPSGQDAAPR